MSNNTEKQEYTITVYTENQVGLLNRIAIIFSRRKINVESLNTSPSEVPGIHRFTIVVMESREVVLKIVRQIEKQVEVIKAYYHTDDDTIYQESCLFKIKSDLLFEERESMLPAKCFCKKRFRTFRGTFTFWGRLFETRF